MTRHKSRIRNADLLPVGIEKHRQRVSDVILQRCVNDAIAQGFPIHGTCTFTVDQEQSKALVEMVEDLQGYCDRIEKVRQEDWDNLSSSTQNELLNRARLRRLGAELVACIPRSVLRANGLDEYPGDLLRAVPDL